MNRFSFLKPGDGGTLLSPHAGAGRHPNAPETREGCGSHVALSSAFAGSVAGFRGSRALAAGPGTSRPSVQLAVEVRHAGPRIRRRQQVNSGVPPMPGCRAGRGGRGFPYHDNRSRSSPNAKKALRHDKYNSPTGGKTLVGEGFFHQMVPRRCGPGIWRFARASRPSCPSSSGAGRG